MLYVGIDVASQKHDCCILDSTSKILRENFCFPNSREGFDFLYGTISSLMSKKTSSDVRIGLESTGHYSTNLLRFLSDKGFEITTFNPLQVNLFRKGQSLRKTKTDKADAKFLAYMLLTDNSKPYTPVSYQISELKSLVRYRSRLGDWKSKLKISVNRLITILFPELSGAVWSIHQNSSYSLLSEYPSAKAIANCHLTKLTNILSSSSHGKYGREKALQLRQLAENSIGSDSTAVGFELQQTIQLIQNLQTELGILDRRIKDVMAKINSPILTIPGISYTLGAFILAEIGDISRFSSPDKLLAFAGLEPSTFQSGKFSASSTPMVKRGSTYLRWALLNAARLVAIYDNTFRDYCAKKKAEGKHHNVAISHCAKKLVRVIFHILKSNSVFVPQS